MASIDEVDGSFALLVPLVRHAAFRWSDDHGLFNENTQVDAVAWEHILKCISSVIHPSFILQATDPAM